MNLSEVLDKKSKINYGDLKKGLDIDVIKKISENNNDPDWMLDLRLRAFEIFKKTPLPSWGPDLSGLNLDEIYYFAKPKDTNRESKTWEDVPDEIKNTFTALGIPEAEKEMLAGVGAQFDSEVVYHSMKKEWQDLGVIFEDMSIACVNHSELLKKYFMKAVPIVDHKFASLHAAVWSGGTFLYIPAGVKLSEPLQAYFRMNIRAGGQFEHTIIVLEELAEAHYIEGCSAPKYGNASLHAGCVELYVKKGAKLRYSSVENWSADTYNLNTKRAIIEENGFIEWVGGNLGAGVTMLYPCSVLLGNNSGANHIGIAFANNSQNIDSGAKVIHIGENTTSKVISKSISKNGGIATYRGLLEIKENAKNSVASIECDGLILDDKSSSIAIPLIKTDCNSSTISHEASVGKINEDFLFYLKSRGISEAKAKEMIINGFLSSTVKELPLEYASELNILINLELNKN